MECTEWYVPLVTSTQNAVLISHCLNYNSICQKLIHFCSYSRTLIIWTSIIRTFWLSGLFLWFHFPWILMSFETWRGENSEIMLKVRKSVLKTAHYPLCFQKIERLMTKSILIHSPEFWLVQNFLLLRECHAWSVRWAWVIETHKMIITQNNMSMKWNHLFSR